MPARTLFLRPQCLRIAPALPLRPTAASLVPRGYSTFVDPRENGQADEVDFDASASDVQADAVDIGLEHALPEGAKYPLPTLPLPPSAVMRKRYPSVLEQVTNLIMRDGKVGFDALGKLGIAGLSIHAESNRSISHDRSSRDPAHQVGAETQRPRQHHPHGAAA
jgi:hypothetical protein